MPISGTRPVLVPGLGLDERSSARLRDLVPAEVVLLPGMAEGPRPPHPSQARGGALDGATTDPRLRSAVGPARRWVATAVGERWPHALLALRQWLRTGPRAMRRLWAVASPDRIDARLRAVRVPVTVVRGTRDRLCPHDWAAAVAAAAPDGRLVEVAGAAHLTPMTHPEQVVELLHEAAGRTGAGRLRPGA